MIIGAFGYSNGESGEGRAFLYLGSASGLFTDANWTAESDQTNAWFGYSVAAAGDINGDGYSDVIVGAPDYDNGQTDEGHAFLYLGSASGLQSTASWSAEGDQAYALFGYSVAAAGDINGDGYADVIVGAYQYDNGESDEGGAFLYLGSASGLSATADWTAESNQANAHFGLSVAAAGDINGDGYSDVIVGAYQYDNGESDEGGTFLYYGNSGGVALNPMQRHIDGSGLLSPSLKQEETQMRLSMLAYSPYGKAKVKLQWEIKPKSTPFDGSSLSSSAIWYDTGVRIDENITGLLLGEYYHWRMRLLYQNPPPIVGAHSQWIYPQRYSYSHAEVGVFFGGTIGFTLSDYSVDENETYATVGGSDREAWVRFDTENGSATEMIDYESAHTMLMWPHGDSSTYNFYILINDDSDPESNETVLLALSNLSVLTSYGLTDVTLTIYDDDPDTDGDGVIDRNEDTNGNGDLNDDDDDGDGTPNYLDSDDEDGPLGDSDGDGTDNQDDNCPDVSNPTQDDSDGDGIGDACDSSNVFLPAIYYLLL